MTAADAQITSLAGSTLRMGGPLSISDSSAETERPPSVSWVLAAQWYG